MPDNQEKIILTLNDHKKYVLVDQIILSSTEYVYLVDIEDNTNLMVCELDGNKLTRVTDEKIVNEVLAQFLKQNQNH